MAKYTKDNYQEIVTVGNEPSGVDLYLNKAFKYILLIIPVAGLFSGLVFTVLKLLDWLPGVSKQSIIIFDVICVLYFVLALIFRRNSFTESGAIKPYMLKMGKILLGVLLVAHWNLISYTIPSTEFWAFAPFFALLAAFLLDEKLVDWVCVALNVSILISWKVMGTSLIAAPGEMYNANMVIRLVGIVLSLYCVHLITLFGRRYLVSELEAIADRDKLTMLLNRRRMNEFLNEYYDDAVAGKNDMCVVMIDVDRFKSINDTYGHDFGDRALKAVAEIISTGIKHDDKAFRWGGDEFMVLFKCDAGKAHEAMERICREIEAQPLISGKNEEVPLSISYGLSAYAPEKSLKEIYDLSDQLLYERKSSKKSMTF